MYPCHVEDNSEYTLNNELLYGFNLEKNNHFTLLFKFHFSFPNGGFVIEWFSIKEIFEILIRDVR